MVPAIEAVGMTVNPVAAAGPRARPAIIDVACSRAICPIWAVVNTSVVPPIIVRTTRSAGPARAAGSVAISDPIRSVRTIAATVWS
jgi:hypothetical protein